MLLFDFDALFRGKNMNTNDAPRDEYDLGVWAAAVLCYIPLFLVLLAISEFALEFGAEIHAKLGDYLFLTFLVVFMVIVRGLRKREEWLHKPVSDAYYLAALVASGGALYLAVERELLRTALTYVEQAEAWPIDLMAIAVIYGAVAGLLMSSFHAAAGWRRRLAYR